MTVRLALSRDINGYVTFGRQPSTDVRRFLLVANAAQNFTVPSNFPVWEIIFSFDPGLRIFVSSTTTATVPTTADSADAEMNPTDWRLNAATVVSLITPDATAYATVTMYAVQ